MRMREIMTIVESAEMAKVYHVTPKRNVKRIMRDGLEPRIGKRSKKGREAVPAIYVFPDYLSMQDGLSGWLGDEFGEDVALSVLELTIPRDWLTRDPHQWEAIIHQTVPPNHIRVVIADVDEHDGKTPDGVNYASDTDDI